MSLLSLNLDFLRTLVMATEVGGFGRAAVLLGRSQSAVSLQMKKLEELVDRPLFRKDGRGVELTEAGELLLSYARQMVELNDEALAAVRGIDVQGTVRFGVPQDFGDGWLPDVLARFNRAHPGVVIEARVDRTDRLLSAIRRGELDLALAWGAPTETSATVIGRVPMCWIASKRFRRDAREPLPLAVFDPPCVFRQPAVEALERARMPWRLSFTTPSLTGLWAAAEAGLGVTVRTRIGLPAHLTVLGRDSGLPKLPEITLALHAKGNKLTTAGQRLRDIIVDELAPRFATAA